MLDKLADIYGVTVSSIFSKNHAKDCDEPNKQILIGALNNHIKKLIQNTNK